jgi:hypothetical protein
MTMNENDSRLSFVPLDRGACNGDIVVASRWWIVHPKRGFVVYRKYSPQCNTREEIARLIAARLYPWAEIRYADVVHIPHRCDPA